MKYVLVTLSKEFPQDTLKKLRHLGAKYLKETEGLYKLLTKVGMLNWHPRILNNIDDKPVWPSDNEFIMSLPSNANIDEIISELSIYRLIYKVEQHDPYLSKIRLQNHSCANQ